MTTMHSDNNGQKSLQLLQAVDESVRRMGGRQYLTADEYLEIVNYHYRRIFESEQSSDVAAV